MIKEQISEKEIEAFKEVAFSDLLKRVLVELKNIGLDFTCKDRSDDTHNPEYNIEFARIKEIVKEVLVEFDIKKYITYFKENRPQNQPCFPGALINETVNRFIDESYGIFGKDVYDGFKKDGLTGVDKIKKANDYFRILQHKKENPD